jgi:hypothetical protein
VQDFDEFSEVHRLGVIGLQQKLSGILRRSSGREPRKRHAHAQTHKPAQQ